MITEQQLEFVELYNRSDEAVVLNDGLLNDGLLNNGLLGGWQIGGGVEFDFGRLPIGTTLTAREVLVVVAFDPGNVTLADQFRSIHGTGPDVVLVGPFGGQFDNGGESVTLRAPSDPPVGELGRQCPMEIRTQTANGIDFLNWQQTYSGSSSSDVMAEIIAAPQGRVGKTLAGDGDTHARRTTRLASSRLQPHMPLFQNGPFLRHPRIATHSDSLARLRDRTTDVHAWDTALLKTLDQEFLP